MHFLGPFRDTRRSKCWEGQPASRSVVHVSGFRGSCAPPGLSTGSSRTTLPGVTGMLAAVLGRRVCLGLLALSWAFRMPSWMRKLCSSSSPSCLQPQLTLRFCITNSSAKQVPHRHIIKIHMSGAGSINCTALTAHWLSWSLLKSAPLWIVIVPKVVSPSAERTTQAWYPVHISLGLAGGSSLHECGCSVAAGSATPQAMNAGVNAIILSGTKKG